MPLLRELRKQAKAVHYTGGQGRRRNLLQTLNFMFPMKCGQSVPYLRQHLQDDSESAIFGEHKLGQSFGVAIWQYYKNMVPLTLQFH